MKKISKWLNKHATLVGVLSNFAVLVVSVVYMQLQINQAKKQAQDSAVINAWQLLTTPAPGNSGKKEALETLAKAGKSLAGIDLSSDRNGGFVSLIGVQLPEADLFDAKFNGTLNETTQQWENGANLWRANFTGANLAGAKFMGTYLHGANFTDADLWEANFMGANLWYTNFTGAKLKYATFKDCWVDGDTESDFPKLPQGWEANFVLENGKPKSRINKDGKIEGYFITITPITQKP